MTPQVFTGMTQAQSILFIEYLDSLMTMLKKIYFYLFWVLTSFFSQSPVIFFAYTLKAWTSILFTKLHWCNGL